MEKFPYFAKTLVFKIIFTDYFIKQCIINVNIFLLEEEISLNDKKIQEKFEDFYRGYIYTYRDYKKDGYINDSIDAMKTNAFYRLLRFHYERNSWLDPSKIDECMSFIRKYYAPSYERFFEEVQRLYQEKKPCRELESRSSQYKCSNKILNNYHNKYINFSPNQFP